MIDASGYFSYFSVQCIVQWGPDSLSGFLGATEIPILNIGPDPAMSFAWMEPLITQWSFVWVYGSVLGELIAGLGL